MTDPEFAYEYVIPEPFLRGLLQRASEGEDPDLLLMEIHANGTEVDDDPS